MLMSDCDFYYRANDPECKSCGGAVRAGQGILFTVRLSRKFYAYNIYLKFGGAGNLRLIMEWDGYEKGFDIYRVFFMPPETGLYGYRFEIDTFGRVYYAGLGKGLRAHIGSLNDFSLTVYENFETPEWFKGGIMYHIFIDRFYRGKETPAKPYAVMHKNADENPDYLPDIKGNYNTDFYGGNLSGITEKLGYIKSLGITCIYLSPVFEAYSNHKYDTGDYGKIDSMFGDTSDFRELCEKAENLGIKIIIDGVFNHTGSDSLYFNKNLNYAGLGACQGKESPYYGWYTFRRFPDIYDCWWGVKTLPAIKKDCPEFREFIAGKGGVLEKWLNEGASGIRIDVADELSNVFLKKINSCCKGVNRDKLIIGEVWEYAHDKSAYGELKEYFWGKELDSVMNYPFLYAVTLYLLNGDSSALSDTLDTIWENYPRAVCHSLMNILGTHDTVRILTALSGRDIPVGKAEAEAFRVTDSEREIAVKRLKTASLLQYTVYGVPCVYYGDEAGAEGCADPFNRKPYPWGRENADLLKWYRFLGKLRESEPVFASGNFAGLYSEGGVYAFERYNEDSCVIAVCNNSENPFSFEISGGLDLITGKACGIIKLEKGGCGVYKLTEYKGSAA